MPRQRTDSFKKNNTVRSRSDGPDLINLATGGARVKVAGGRRRRRRGMPRSDENKRNGKGLLLPLGAGDRGGNDGEVDGDEPLWFAGNCSPESVWAANSFGRGRIRRSGARKNTGASQGGAQDRNDKRGEGEEERGALRSPEMELSRRRTGGARRTIPSILGALEWCYRGQTREEEEGVF